MKTSVQDTSFKAWRDLQEKLPAARKEVFDTISAHPNSTLTELATILHRPVNRVSGRITELRKAKLIEDGGKRRDRITGNTAHNWRVKPPIELPPAREEKKVETIPNQLF